MHSRHGERIQIIWSQRARIQLRNIDRDTALDLLKCLDRYAKTRAGDVKKLGPPLTGFRLRCGDYRLFFHLEHELTIEIDSVRHRSEAYR